MRAPGKLGRSPRALREEPDLRSALDLLARYSSAYNGILELRVVEVDGVATVEVWVDFGQPVPVREPVVGNPQRLLEVAEDGQPPAVYERVAAAV